MWSHYQLGEVLSQQQCWKEAIFAYTKAVHIDPNFPWLQYRLGKALAKENHWLEAIKFYKKAIEIKSDFVEAYCELGNALSHQKQWIEAVEAYKKALEYQPELPVSVYHNLGYALNKKKGLEVNQSHQNLIKNNSTLEEENNQKIIDQNLINQKVESCLNLLKISPNKALSYSQLGDVLLQRIKLDSDQAISFYYHAIQLNPDDLETYHKALNLNPKDVDLYINLSSNLVKQNKLEEAITFYQIALLVKPNDPEIKLELSKLLEKQNF
jgi:tetratricopeptide (TPR) repeat protein